MSWSALNPGEPGVIVGCSSPTLSNTSQGRISASRVRSTVVADQRRVPSAGKGSRPMSPRATAALISLSDRIIPWPVEILELVQLHPDSVGPGIGLDRQGYQCGL